MALKVALKVALQEDLQEARIREERRGRGPALARVSANLSVSVPIMAGGARQLLSVK